MTVFLGFVNVDGWGDLVCYTCEAPDGTLSPSNCVLMVL